MAVELAVGYVSIIPETSKIAPTLAKALGKADAQFEAAGRSGGNRFSAAMSNALATAGGFLMAKAAMAIGGAVGTAITKGITRYTQIENAEKKLSALGNSASAITRIMEGASKSVKGTAFGMGEAADVAAAAVASGIKPGAQLDQVLRTIANSAAIAGMDMKSMGAIFNKAAASGKVQGDILAQLGDNGVPAVQWLSKELGVSAAQVYKLGEQGKISFEQFESAMRNGMDPNAAVMMGDTLTGMWANSQAALGRLGAEVMKVLGPMLKNALAGSIERVDALTKAVGPALQKVQELAGPVWSYLQGVASDTWDQIMVTAGPALDGLKDRVMNLFSGIGQTGWLDAVKSELDLLPRTIEVAQEIWRNGFSNDAPAWLDTLVVGFRDLWDRGVALTKALLDLGAALAPIAVDAAKVVAVIGGAIVLVAWEAFKVILDVITPLISGLAGLIRDNKTAVEILGGAILITVGAYKAAQMGIAAYNAVMLFGKGIQQAFTAASYGSTAATYAQNAAQKIAMVTGRIYYGVIATAKGIQTGFAVATTGATRAVVANTAATRFGAVAGKAWVGAMALAKAVQDGSALATARLTAAIIIQKGVMLAQRAALAIATAAQWAWNAAMSANPIGLVVLAIAALVAGVIWAYNNVGWFRDGVNAAWAGIKAAVAVVADWFTNTLWPGIKAVWDGISGGAVTAWQTITGALQTAWSWISGVFLAGWGLLKSWLIDPFLSVVNAVVGAFTAIANWVMPWVAWFQGVFAAAWGVLQFLILLPIRLAQIAIEWAWGKITEAFWNAWAWVSGVFMASWNLVTGFVAGVVDAAKNLISATWQAITDRFWAAWSWVSGIFMAGWNLLVGWLSGPVDSAKNWISNTWNLIIAGFASAWNWVSGTFMSWWRTLTGLVGSVMDSVRSGIDSAWSWITRIFTDAWNWVSGTFRGWWGQLTDLMRGPVDMAKGAIDQILGGIRNAFEQAVNFIRDTWAKVKDAVAAPVKIAIEIGNKLIGGFRSVADKVGLKVDMPDIPPLPAYAQGTNRVPGSRANGVDSTLAVASSGIPIARVDPGEGIIRYAAMRLLDRRHPGAFDYINRFGALPGFATGGRVHPVPGYPANMGRGVHGVDRGLDIPAPMGTPVVAMRDGRVMSTARWNYSYGFHIRTSDGAVYAHLSDILVNPGQEIRAGQVIGKVGSTGNSSGPHLHVTAYDGASAVGKVLGAGAGAVQQITDWVGDLKGKFAGPLKDLGARVGDSPFGQIAKKIPNVVADGMVEKVKDAVGKLAAITDSNSNIALPAGPAVERWRPVVLQALRMMGQPESLADTTLRRLNQESSGNPSIVNNWDVNARRGTPSKGLMQVIDPTFRAYAMPGYSSNIFDPLSNILASMRYALARYGSLSAAYNRKGGYWRGTQSARPGLAVVGEQGRELIDFGRGGARVFNNTDTEEILSGKAKEQTVIQIQGNVGWSPDEVAEQIAKRQRRARVRAGLIGAS